MLGFAKPQPNLHSLLCVAGWSPLGIDCGATDGIPVSIIAMYLVPENQRNHFLREAFMLAKVPAAYPGLEKLSPARELNEVREHLLDLISTSKESVGPDTCARMIQLQARPSVAAISAYDLASLVVEPLTLVTGHGLRHIVLTQDHRLAERLDSVPGLVDGIAAEGMFQKIRRMAHLEERRNNLPGRSRSVRLPGCKDAECAMIVVYCRFRATCCESENDSQSSASWRYKSVVRKTIDASIVFIHTTR